MLPPETIIAGRARPPGRRMPATAPSWSSGKMPSAHYSPPACIEHQWNISETARSLGMPRSNLYSQDRKVRADQGDAMTGPRDWDKEMAEIDKLMGSDRPAAALPPGGGAVAAARALRRRRTRPLPAVMTRRRDTAGVWFRALLGAAGAAALPFWPYSKSCGTMLYRLSLRDAVASWLAESGPCAVRGRIAAAWRTSPDCLCCCRAYSGCTRSTSAHRLCGSAPHVDLPLIRIGLSRLTTSD